MATNYGPAARASLGATIAPEARGVDRYRSAAELCAAIRAAAELVPEIRPEHEFPERYRVEFIGEPVPAGFTLGEIGHAPTLPAGGLERFDNMDDEAAGPGCVWPMRRERPEAPGPYLPAPADARVTFSYACGAARGSLTVANTRGALLALADKVHAARGAFDGKVKRAPRPAAPSGSAPHVTARAMVAAGDHSGALAIAEQRGAVFFGAAGRAGDPSTLHPYMSAEPVDVAGVPCIVARSMRTGRFRVLGAASGLAVDCATAGAPDDCGFRSASLALAWLESRTQCEDFSGKLQAAAGRAAPLDQAAARAAWLAAGAQDPDAAPADAPAADPGPVAAPAAADGPEHAPAADRPAMAPEAAAARPVQGRATRAEFEAARLQHAIAAGARADADHAAAVAAVRAGAGPGVTVREVSAAEWDRCAALRAAAATLERIAADWAPDAGRSAAIVAARAGAPDAAGPLAGYLQRAADRGGPLERREAAAALADLRAAGAHPDRAIRAESTPTGQSGPAPRAPRDGDLYRIHWRSRATDGEVWTGAVTMRADRAHHVTQCVIAGYTSGERWATCAETGAFLAGIGANGRAISAAPVWVPLAAPTVQPEAPTGQSGNPPEAPETLDVTPATRIPELLTQLDASMADPAPWDAGLLAALDMYRRTCPADWAAAMRAGPDGAPPTDQSALSGPVTAASLLAACRAAAQRHPEGRAAGLADECERLAVLVDATARENPAALAPRAEALRILRAERDEAAAPPTTQSGPAADPAEVARLHGIMRGRAELASAAGAPMPDALRAQAAELRQRAADLRKPLGGAELQHSAADLEFRAEARARMDASAANSDGAAAELEREAASWQADRPPATHSQDSGAPARRCSAPDMAGPGYRPESLLIDAARGRDLPTPTAQSGPFRVMLDGDQSAGEAATLAEARAIAAGIIEREPIPCAVSIEDADGAHVEDCGIAPGLPALRLPGTPDRAIGQSTGSDAAPTQQSGPWRFSACAMPEYAPANRPVHVLFTPNRARALGQGGQAAGACVGYYMARQTYNAIPPTELATPADFERFGPLQAAPSDFLWSADERAAELQRNGQAAAEPSANAHRIACHLIRHAREACNGVPSGATLQREAARLERNAAEMARRGAAALASDYEAAAGMLRELADDAQDSAPAAPASMPAAAPARAMRARPGPLLRIPAGDPRTRIPGRFAPVYLLRA